MKQTPIYVVLGFVLLTISSCIKEDDIRKLRNVEGVELESEHAIALFNDDFKVRDFLYRADSFKQLVINNEGFFSYIVGQNSTSLIGNDFISIPNASISGNFIFPGMVSAAFNAAPVGTVITDSVDIFWDLDLLPLEIDSIIYKLAQLDIQLNSNFNVNHAVRLVIEDLRDPNLQSFVFFTPNLRGNFVNISEPLNGYKADLTLESSQYNLIKLKFIYTLSKSTSSEQILAGQRINYSLGLRDQQFSKLYGYFGQQLLNIPTASIELGLFDNTVGTGTITIEDPRINLYFDNSFGMGVRVDAISPFQGITQNGSIIPITGVSLPFVLNAAGTLGAIERTTLLLREPQVNTKQLASSKVVQIDFAAQATVNPNERVRNFASDTSRVVLTSEVELPFHGTLKDFSIQQQSEFSIPEDVDIVEYAEIKLIVENTLPLSLDFQLYFLDSNDVVKDSLYQSLNGERLVVAAPVNNQAQVTGSASKVSFIKIDKQKLQQLADLDVTQVQLLVFASTTNEGAVPVKLYPDYGIVIKAGLKVKIKGVQEI